MDRWHSNRPYFKITLRLRYLELWPRGHRNSWRTGREKVVVGHSLGDEYRVTLGGVFVELTVLHCLTARKTT